MVEDRSVVADVVTSSASILLVSIFSMSQMWWASTIQILMCMNLAHLKQINPVFGDDYSSMMSIPDVRKLIHHVEKRRFSLQELCVKLILVILVFCEPFVVFPLGLYIWVALFGFVGAGLVEGYSVYGFVLYPFIVNVRLPCHSMTSLCDNHELRRMRLLIGEV